MGSDARPIMWVLVVGAAVTGIAALALHRSDTPPEPPSSPPASPEGPPPRPQAEPSLPPPKPGPVAHPPSAFAELYVLTDLPDAQIAPMLETKAVAALTNDDAVRAFVEKGMHFEIEPPGETKLPRELALAAPTLTDDERAGLGARRAIVVRAEGEAFPDQLPARATYAVAAALADKTKGFVLDDLVERVERGAQLRARTTTKDRIDVQYATRGSGHVRLLTTGLRRFGCPDIDIPEVDPRFAQAMSDVLYAAADACVRGADTNPVTLALPAPAHGDAPVYLVPFEGEPDDPSDWMAHLVPETGASPSTYAGLAIRFYGDAIPKWEPPPDESTLAAQRAQKLLDKLLARVGKKDGTTLLLEVRLDDTPDDSGAPPDTAWIQVTSFDATTVTGKLAEDAEAADLDLGAPLTRPRSMVVDYQLEDADGGIEEL